MRIGSGASMGMMVALGDEDGGPVSVGRTISSDEPLWVCPECKGTFYMDWGGPDGTDVCPHCKDPIARFSRKVEPPLGKDADGVPIPHGWIQWKGTEVCMDVHCKCGAHLHIDDDFVYFVQCPYCDRVYMVGQQVRLYEMSGEARAAALEKNTLHKLDADEDDDFVPDGAGVVDGEWREKHLELSGGV